MRLPCKRWQGFQAVKQQDHSSSDPAWAQALLLMQKLMHLRIGFRLNNGRWNLEIKDSPPIRCTGPLPAMSTTPVNHYESKGKYFKSSFNPCLNFWGNRVRPKPIQLECNKPACSAARKCNKLWSCIAPPLLHWQLLWPLSRKKVGTEKQRKSGPSKGHRRPGQWRNHPKRWKGSTRIRGQTTCRIQTPSKWNHPAQRR